MDNVRKISYLIDRTEEKQQRSEGKQTVPLRVMIGPAVRTAFPDAPVVSFSSNKSLFFLLPQIYEKINTKISL